MDVRKAKGIEIAKRGGIAKGMKGWVVPSQRGSQDYIVLDRGVNSTCTCQDFQNRNQKCKHIWGVQFFIKETLYKEKSNVRGKVVRMTYPQNWRLYNKVQTQELVLFDELLRHLVDNIEEPKQKRGRPRLSLRESIFCAIKKVYSHLSQRRSYALYRNSEEKEHITHTPHFNAVGKLLNRKDITPLLTELLTISAMPLKGVETVFAPDSSGFRTTKFDQYYVEKHKIKRRHRWVKCHIVVGVKTNTIVSAKITKDTGADCPQLKPLVSDAHKNGFNIKEIVADKAYLSRENLNFIDKIGAFPYIPFKSNTTSTTKGSLVWGKMYHYFQLNREEFMEHYHKRSNVETTFQMIKSKFGDMLKSKNWTAQQNELLCKLVCHNICVLMQEIGVKPNFM